MNRVLVPAENWDAKTAANSCMNAIEQKDGKLISVRTFEYHGFLYTSFGSMHCQYSAEFKPTVWAYKLLPLSWYGGETTTIYHDEEAIAAGRRDRGNLSGLVVLAKGKKLVCAEQVLFSKDLPKTRPMQLTDAQTFDTLCAQYGWRALYCSNSLPIWKSLGGHPVAEYKNDAGEKSLVLFYREGKTIYEMELGGDIPLVPWLDKTSEATPGNSVHPN